MTQERFNIALLPRDEIFSETLAAWSQNLRDNFPSKYVVGEDSLAHVTLTQFYAEQSFVEQVAGRLDQIVLPEALKLDRFYCDLTRNKVGHFYSGIGVVLSRSLRVAHEASLRIIDPCETLTKTDPYFPHFTLGLNKLEDGQETYLNEEGGLLWNTPVECRIAVGQCGTEGQFEKILYEI